MRETGPVAKRVPQGGEKYLGLARTLLGQLKARMGGVPSGWWRKTLPDGTEIRVASIHGQDFVHVVTPSRGVSSAPSTLYMDSGYLVPGNFAWLDPEVIEPGTLYQSDNTATWQAMWSGPRYGTTFKPVEGVDGAAPPCLTYDPANATMKAACWDKTANHVGGLNYAPAMSSGKLRLFNQAKLGLPVGHPLFVQYENPIGANLAGWALVTADNGDYWIVRLDPPHGDITLTRLDTSTTLRTALAELADFDERRWLEAYILAHATLSSESQTIAWPSGLPGGSPLYGGWSWDWTGHEARICVMEHQGAITNALWYGSKSRVQSSVVQLTLSQVGGAWSASLSVVETATWRQENGLSTWVWYPAPTGYTCPFGAAGDGPYTETPLPNGAPIKVRAVQAEDGSTSWDVIRISTTSEVRPNTESASCVWSDFAYWSDGAVQPAYYEIRGGTMITQSATVESVTSSFESAGYHFINRKVLSYAPSGDWVAHPDTGCYVPSTYQTVNCVDVSTGSCNCPEGGGVSTRYYWTGTVTGEHLQSANATSAGGVAVVFPADVDAVVVYKVDAHTATGDKFTWLMGRTDIVPGTNNAWWASKWVCAEGGTPNPLGQRVTGNKPGVLSISSTPGDWTWGDSVARAYGAHGGEILVTDHQPLSADGLNLLGGGWLAIHLVTDPCWGGGPVVRQGCTSAMAAALSDTVEELTGGWPPTAGTDGKPVGCA